ncbi:EAL domain, c-di-GMP-specific phosphodiesterase class I (or its enzymatically inactive variant) [Bacillus sp. OV322]|uniref:putative bifunctional diguanylate cyclase/phosphodiesterase n=1 Tax=Bacillus sp. OV322 TaxID=1882764 RepID=UPI0008E1822C|nr:EAL domain-containing protein [Bacillus sp. OV322]SFC09815.1 EAL domain, c-di-GMP-specific phosphodiesterase class I (or its enzymatically inactive variant) [Bacillus sp. OV322]
MSEFLNTAENISVYGFAASDLNKALQNNEFALHYQPQVSAKTGAMVGFEALIRWNHPMFGLIAPGDFIPLAEESGFILQMGDWVVKTACEQIKQWHLRFGKGLKVAVNLSIKQFSDQLLVENIKNALENTGLDPHYLELELTESVTGNMELIMNTVKKLKALGVGISIDDFGRGYSSLYFLKELEIDKLKLDRSFIIDIHKKKDQTIVQSMLLMAKGLKLEVVAEGIETKEQMEIFAKECDYLQGFYICKPLPKREIEKLLRKRVRAS